MFEQGSVFRCSDGTKGCVSRSVGGVGPGWEGKFWEDSAAMLMTIDYPLVLPCSVCCHDQVASLSRVGSQLCSVWAANFGQSCDSQRDVRQGLPMTACTSTEASRVRISALITVPSRVQPLLSAEPSRRGAFSEPCRPYRRHVWRLGRYVKWQ